MVGWLESPCGVPIGAMGCTVMWHSLAADSSHSNDDSSHSTDDDHHDGTDEEDGAAAVDTGMGFAGFTKSQKAEIRRAIRSRRGVLIFIGH